MNILRKETRKKEGGKGINREGEGGGGIGVSRLGGGGGGGGRRNSGRRISCVCVLYAYLVVLGRYEYTTEARAAAKEAGGVKIKVVRTPGTG